jgi:hypothetical protein
MVEADITFRPKSEGVARSWPLRFLDSSIDRISSLETLTRGKRSSDPTGWARRSILGWPSSPARISLSPGRRCV